MTFRKEPEDSPAQRGSTHNGPLFPRTVEDHLTDSHLAECARKMADLIGRKEGIEQERKQTQHEFTSRITATEKEIAELGRKVTKGTELREVNVYWRFNFSADTKELVRADTDEVLLTGQEISEGERQEQFNFDGGTDILDQHAKDIQRNPPPPPPEAPPATEPEAPGQ